MFRFRFGLQDFKDLDYQHFKTSRPQDLG